MQQLTDQLRKTLGPAALPLLLNETLNPRSAEYKEKQLVGFLGMSMEELAKKGGPGMWERAEAEGGPLSELAALLKKEEGGPFVMGAAGETGYLRVERI